MFCTIVTFVTLSLEILLKKQFSAVFALSARERYIQIDIFAKWRPLSVFEFTIFILFRYTAPSHVVFSSQNPLQWQVEGVMEPNKCPSCNCSLFMRHQ